MFKKNAFRIKMGNVFQLHTKEVVLVCSHCLEEFVCFTEFSVHVQEHLKQLWHQSVVTFGDINKKDGDQTESLPEKSSNQQDLSTETATNTDTLAISMKTEESIDGDAAENLSSDNNIECWLQNPNKSEPIIDFNEPLVQLPANNKTFSTENSNKPQDFAIASTSSNILVAENADQPLDLKVKLETANNDDGHSKADRYDELLKEYNATSSTAQSLRVLKRFRDKLTLFEMDDTPEARMLANIYMKASEYGRIQVNGKRNMCPICGKAYVNCTGMRSHIFSHSKTNLFHCLMCTKRIRSPSWFRKHLRTYTNHRFECYLCKDQFNDYHALVQHMNGKHTPYAYCIQCDKQFNVLSVFKQHMKDHHSNVTASNGDTIDSNRVGNLLGRTISSWQCYMCQKEFSTRVGTLRHMQTHNHCEELYPISGRQFRSTPCLRRHMQSHNSVRSHSCVLCDKAYIARKYLLKHWKKKHNIHVGTSCRICSAKFARRTDWKEHMKVHSAEEKLLRCLNCDFTTQKAYILAKHVRIHSAEKFDCPICHKKIRQSSRYVHMRSHTNKTEFKCTVCDKVLKSRGTLNMHSIRHQTNRQVYKCDICYKSFVYRNSLAHRRMHVEPMPFHCRYCNLGYLLASSLRNHEATHERENTAKQQES